MRKKGFTLIEMMIALSIFSLFVGFLYKAYFTQIKENHSFNTRLDLKYNGDKAMNLIADELRSNIIPAHTGNINQIIVNNKALIDLTGNASSWDLKLTGGNTLVDSANEILCKGITAITMQYSGELILITIDLNSNNDEYTVSSAVNINK